MGLQEYFAKSFTQKKVTDEGVADEASADQTNDWLSKFEINFTYLNQINWAYFDFN